MENISNFLTAAENYGCARGDLFQSVYLTDGQNMPAVIGGIHALGRRVSVTAPIRLNISSIKTRYV